MYSVSATNEFLTLFRQALILSRKKCFVASDPMNTINHYTCVYIFLNTFSYVFISLINFFRVNFILFCSFLTVFIISNVFDTLILQCFGMLIRAGITVNSYEDLISLFLVFELKTLNVGNANGFMIMYRLLKGEKLHATTKDESVYVK